MYFRHWSIRHYDISTLMDISTVHDISTLMHFEIGHFDTEFKSGNWMASKAICVDQDRNLQHLFE